MLIQSKSIVNYPTEFDQKVKMKVFVVFGVLVVFTSSLWRVDCSPESRRTKRYFTYGGNTVAGTSVNGQPVTVQGLHTIPPAVQPYGVGSGMGFGVPVYNIPNGNILPSQSSPSPGTQYSVMHGSGHEREIIINGRRVPESEMAHSGFIYPYGMGPVNPYQNNPLSPPRSSSHPVNSNAAVNWGTERTIRRPNFNQNIPSSTESNSDVQDKTSAVSFPNARRPPGIGIRT